MKQTFIKWFFSAGERIAPLMFLIGGEIFIIFIHKQFRLINVLWEVGIHTFLIGIIVLLFIKSYKNWKDLK